jgi:glutathione S-transferase
MTDLYFHHYANSPFAEKIRRILAYKEMPWQSVMQPPIMPKPELTALTGGYRRIPMLQLGADIFCDTALICDVLETLKPTPSIFTQPTAAVAKTIAAWADSTLFAVAMAFNFGPKGAAAFFAKMPPEFATAFIEDRKAMRLGAARMHPSDATSAYRIYLTRINDMVANSFACGATPSVADFSIYHSLWFTRNLPELAPVLHSYPNIIVWMDRIAALGKDLSNKSNASEALETAKAGSTPFFSDQASIDDHGIALGASVTITAESFGPEASIGTLIAATEDRYSIARTDERAGAVRVHFPRTGFVLKAV